MASIFSPRHPPPPDAAPAVEEHDRAEVSASGGKILRGRRRLDPQRASPYARPRQPAAATAPSLPLPYSTPSTGSPKWLIGLISGAGKLISSVFGHYDDTSSSPSSSGCFSDEDLGGGSDQEEDFNQPKELHELNQEGKKLKSQNYMEGSPEIISLSEPKHAIEQLLMQQTFSRDECTRLTTLIQSRVVDSSSSKGFQHNGKNEVLNICTGSTSGLPGGCRVLNQKEELTKSVPSSASNLGTLLPRFPSSLAFEPDLLSKAAMEAKRLIEDKKLTSNLNSDTVSGPSLLNMDMPHYDESSPSDVAKSYMRSLPPWSYTSILNTAANASPPSKLHLHKGNYTPLAANSSLPSFKVFKRKYLSGKLTESPEDTRRIRMRSSEYLLMSPDSGRAYSSARLVENETLKVSSHAKGDRETIQANPPPNGLKVQELSAEDAENFGTSDKIISRSMPLQIEEAVTAVESVNMSEPPTTLLRDSHAKLEEPASSLIKNNEENVIELLQTKDQYDFIDSKPLVLASSEVDSGGDMLSKENSVSLEGINLTTKGNIQGSDIHMKSKAFETLDVHNAVELILQSGSEHHFETPRLKDEENGLIDKTAMMSSSAELNSHIILELSGKDNLSNDYSSHDKLIRQGKDEHLHEAANEMTAVLGADCIEGKSQSGMSMRSIEHVPTEPLSSNSRPRRKAVVKMVRGTEPLSSNSRPRRKAVVKMVRGGRGRGRGRGGRIVDN